MGGASGSSGKPGFPPAFDAIAGLLGGVGGDAGTGGLFSDLFFSTFGGQAPGGGPGSGMSPLGSANIYGPQSIFAQQFNPMLAAGFRGGDVLRQLGAQGSQQALVNAQGLAGLQGAQAAGLAGLNPADFAGAAANFGQNINAGANALQGALGSAQGLGQQYNDPTGTFGGAITSAQQALADVMNPTSQNSLFENAANLLTPRVRAAFSARGLGSSGAAIEEEGNQLQQLADSFAIRQAQERQAALQGVGALGAQQGGLLNQALGLEGQFGQGLGQLGVAGAQVPGQVFSQLAQGGALQQQALAAAQQGNLAPLQALQAGGQLFQQGLDMPLANFNNLLALRNIPIEQITPLLGGISGAKQSPEFLSSLGIPKG